MFFLFSPDCWTVLTEKDFIFLEAVLKGRYLPGLSYFTSQQVVKIHRECEELIECNATFSVLSPIVAWMDTTSSDWNQMLKLETIIVSGVEMVILLYYLTVFEHWQIYMSHVAPLFHSDSFEFESNLYGLPTLRKTIICSLNFSHKKTPQK